MPMFEIAHEIGRGYKAQHQPALLCSDGGVAVQLAGIGAGVTRQCQRRFGLRHTRLFDFLSARI